MIKFNKTKPDVIDHSADTWLLANGIHLLILAIIGRSVIFSMGLYSVGIALLVAMVIIAASLPCLAMAYFSLGIIARSALPVKTLFITWLVVCACMVLVEGVLMEFLFKSTTAYRLIHCIPAVVAVLLAASIRYRRFKTLIIHYRSYSII